MGLINLERQSGRPVEPDLVFFLMPYEKKRVPDGAELDFDFVYQRLKKVVTGLGMRGDRADENADTTLGVLEAAWDGVDRAGVVVVDLSVPSTSVAMELGWAMCLHKRMVVIAYEGAEVPTNLRGQLRPLYYTRDLESFAQLEIDLEARIEAERLRTDPEMDLTERTTDSGAFAATAVVEVAYPDRVFVRDVQDPLRCAEMRREDVGYEEMVPDDMAAAKNYRQGSMVSGHFVVDQGRVTFTRRHRQDNPWPRRVAGYPPRQNCAARVTSVSHAGAFIELLAFGGKSFIPPYQARAVGLSEGDEIQVRVSKVDPQQRRIEVALTEAPQANPAEPPEGEYPKAGERFVGTLFDVNLKGGYVRVRLAGYRRLGLLHVSNMREELWQDIRAGAVTTGGELHVGVTKVVPSRGRIAQWDIGLEQVSDPAGLLVVGEPDAVLLPEQVQPVAGAGEAAETEGDPVG